MFLETCVDEEQAKERKIIYEGLLNLVGLKAEIEIRSLEISDRSVGMRVVHDLFVIIDPKTPVPKEVYERLNAAVRRQEGSV